MIGRAVSLQNLMHKIFEELPQSVIVEGKAYDINTDFRVWVQICSYMESDEFSYEDKILKLLCDAYTRELPPHLDSAIDALFDFMVQGKVRESSNGGACEKVIDFYLDEGLIYAAFMQQYGIDLYSQNLHWWSFINLLNSLDENTAFMKIVGYRGMNCDAIKNKELKKFYRRMKNKYRLYRDVNDNEIASTLESVM